jgi:hypothetical protein
MAIGSHLSIDGNSSGRSCRSGFPGPVNKQAPEGAQKARRPEEGAPAPPEDLVDYFFLTAPM